MADLLQKRVQRVSAAPLDAPRPDAAPQNQAPAVDPRKLVLQPRQMPLEERLKMVMSLEDVQRLLLLRSPYPQSPSLRSLFEGEKGLLVDRLG
ncbi:MAG: hypothetical protein K1X75_06850 [Leptospirales bacterium]|nr:hypothetical protein [Leptospirales bacterium]